MYKDIAKHNILRRLEEVKFMSNDYNLFLMAKWILLEKMREVQRVVNPPSGEKYQRYSIQQETAKTP